MERDWRSRPLSRKSMDMNKHLRRKYWGHVFIWVICIYSTLSIVRPICEFLKETLPFSFLTNLLLGLLLFVVIIVLTAKIKIRSRLGYLLLLTTVLLYIYSFNQIQYPEEKIHFAEYGLLSYLIYKALRVDFKNVQAFIGAFLLTSALGWGDEGIQYILPNRYYQINDVLLNIWSGALGLLLVFIFQREIRLQT